MDCLSQTHLRLGTVIQNPIPDSSEDVNSRTQKFQGPAFVGLSRHISISHLSRTSRMPLSSKDWKGRSGRLSARVNASASSAGLPSVNDLPLITYINNQGRIIPPIEAGTQASVFAVFDANKKIQYIGFSKDVRNSLRTLMGRRAELCYFYKVYNLKELDQKAMVEIRKHVSRRKHAAGWRLVFPTACPLDITEGMYALFHRRGANYAVCRNPAPSSRTLARTSRTLARTSRTLAT